MSFSDSRLWKMARQTVPQQDDDDDDILSGLLGVTTRIAGVLGIGLKAGKKQRTPKSQTAQAIYGTRAPVMQPRGAERKPKRPPGTVSNSGPSPSTSRPDSSGLDCGPGG